VLLLLLLLLTGCVMAVMSRLSAVTAAAGMLSDESWLALPCVYVRLSPSAVNIHGEAKVRDFGDHIMSVVDVSL
jgi:hypothetical protein